MFAEERHRLVTEQLSLSGKVGVADLSERFGITRETVRRDLAQLEQVGVLRRVHGGAVAAAKTSTAEQSHTARTTQNLAAKRRIAAKALELLPQGATSILLDAGTTTELLAGLLAEELAAPRAEELLVITHALPIAQRVSPALPLELIGGRVRGLTSAATGSHTLAQLDSLRPDIAFVGANGVDAGFGLSTPDALEAAVKTAIVGCARRVVVLADSSKLGETALVRFAALSDIDTLVTDREPDAELAAALEAADVEVVLA
ncbi:DeoR/GlpR family DNA-binding transcription regulator [Paeniglutamicibacter sp. NPDC012692]|uniref:DeoR/GlpR family DNA-binding transcription regulator n=1 Tax=Paeniglutamicibacter sp. NPDC012692 TaxID=3364388 RepID=UPI00368EBEC9